MNDPGWIRAGLAFGIGSEAMLLAYCLWVDDWSHDLEKAVNGYGSMRVELGVSLVKN